MLSAKVGIQTKIAFVVFLLAFNAAKKDKKQST